MVVTGWPDLERPQTGIARIHPPGSNPAEIQQIEMETWDMQTQYSIKDTLRSRRRQSAIPCIALITFLLAT